MNTLEIWGTVDHSFTRLESTYASQIDETIYDKLISCPSLLKDIGIKSINHPCLWESVAPKEIDQCHWKRLDEKLNQIKNSGINPIIEFLHHGSGPFYTSLVDPDFPEKFSHYVRQFINRHPWPTEFCPIYGMNRTAQMSCLSGHWYPHLKSELYYLKAILHQCKGTVLAMREVRRVNPKAKLIQTELIGNFQSTPVLNDRRNFENQRQWIALDILTGKMDRTHPLYEYITSKGIRDEELHWFQNNPCPPSYISITHDRSCDRYLDHRTNLYPEKMHSISDAGEVYVDIKAASTGQAEIVSAKNIFLEAWERYKTPLVLSENLTHHLRESQMRSLNQVWKMAQELGSNGVTVKAVITPNLIGQDQRPGAFEIKKYDHSVSSTALAKLIQDLTTREISEHPILASEGVWETPRRMLFGVKPGDFSRIYHRSDARPVLITGASENLGLAIAEICGARNIFYKLLKRREMDITDRDSIEETIDVYRPWAIINAAGLIQSDDQEVRGHIISTDTVQGAVNLARVCREKKVSLVNFSTKRSLSNFASNTYKKYRIETEDQVLSIYPESLIIRMDDTSSSMVDFAHECLNLLIDGEKGIHPLQQNTSWDEFVINEQLQEHFPYYQEIQ